MSGNRTLSTRNFNVTLKMVIGITAILFAFAPKVTANPVEVMSEELDTTGTVNTNKAEVSIGVPDAADSVSAKSAESIKPSEKNPTVIPAVVLPDTAIAVNGDSLKAPEIAPEEMVIEIDPKQSRNSNKSLPLALGLSALLPGAGEIYLSDKKPAQVFLLAEIGFWSALYIAFLAQDNYLQSARNYASEYAGIDAQGKDEEFLNTMGNYRSYLEKQHRQDSYEISQILSGKRNQDYEIPKTSDNFWDFGSSINPQNTDNWQTFQSSMRYYRASKVAVSFAIGALALNRIISVANTLHVFKHTSAKGLTFNIIPEIGHDYTGGRLSLGF